MAANCGFLFYNDIYRVSRQNIETDPGKIQYFLKTIMTDNINECFVVGNENLSFSVTTSEPGMLLGTGLPHGVRKDDNDFKIGFYFDHTFGLPLIPGSSVKGTLRSVFPSYEKDKSTLAKIKDVKSAWLISLINHINDDDFFETTYQPVDDLNDVQKKYITELELEIFEGIRKEHPLSIYDRDIFHDALLASNNAKIFGVDYVTPHKHKTNPDLDPFCDPNPIKFLRIMHGISFEFNFDLKDSEIEFNGLKLSASDKAMLFWKILLTTGIGAKTNVGYGQVV